MIKKTILKSYAELIVRSGIALKKGQEVVIRAQVELEPFAELVARECYRAGASRVCFEWQSSKMTRLLAKYGKEKVTKFLKTKYGQLKAGKCRNLQTCKG